MHGRPALLALCSNNGYLERIIKTKGLTIQGVLHPQLNGKKEAAGICLVPLKKE